MSPVRVGKFVLLIIKSEKSIFHLIAFPGILTGTMGRGIPEPGTITSNSPIVFLRILDCWPTSGISVWYFRRVLLRKRKKPILTGKKVLGTPEPGTATSTPHFLILEIRNYLGRSGTSVSFLRRVLKGAKK